jgi:hypothetical protein
MHRQMVRWTVNDQFERMWKSITTRYYSAFAWTDSRRPWKISEQPASGPRLEPRISQAWKVLLTNLRHFVAILGCSPYKALSNEPEEKSWKTPDKNPALMCWAQKNKCIHQTRDMKRAWNKHVIPHSVTWFQYRGTELKMRSFSRPFYSS